MNQGVSYCLIRHYSELLVPHTSVFLIGRQKSVVTVRVICQVRCWVFLMGSLMLNVF